MPPKDIALPRPAIRVLAGGIAILALFLCRWQVRRDGERNAGREQALLVAGLPPVGDESTAEPGVLWRVVSWQGHYAGRRVLLAGSLRGDERGYRLLQAFHRVNGTKILVDRGWVGAPAVDGVLAAPEEEPPSVLTGQLRPVTGDVEEVPMDGHATLIWQLGETRAPAVVLTGSAVGVVSSGALDGRPLEGGPAIGGFEAVPERDNASAHYASQWLAIALGGLAFAFPGLLMRGPLMRVWQKLSAGGDGPR